MNDNLSETEIAQTNLRKKALQIRENIISREQKNSAIFENLIDLIEYKNAEKIACYLNINNEVSTKNLIENIWQKGKEIYLPFVKQKESVLEFVNYKKDEVLSKDYLGLLAPNLDNKIIKLSELDLIIVPLVAFDLESNRIGMGGGYYDRTLKLTNCPKIGLAFWEQKVEKIIPNKWDVRLDKIITN